MTEVSSPIYQKFSTWMNNNAQMDKLDIQYANIENKMVQEIQSGATEESVFAKYSEEINKNNEEYNALLNVTNRDFSFMEGKDSNNEEEYNEQLMKIAQGDFNRYDLDDNGEVKLTEYLARELVDMEEIDEGNEILVKAYGQMLFQIMDEGMGNSDSNGTLSVDEFASFYKNMDQFDINQENPLTGEFDGVLDYLNSSDMPSWLIENIISEETIEQTIEFWEKASQ